MKVKGIKPWEFPCGDGRAILLAMHLLSKNLQVVSLQGCQRAFHQGVSGVAACPALPSLLVVQLYHRPPPLPPPACNSSFLFSWCQPLDASCCTGLLYGTGRFMYYLCEKNYKPITIQYLQPINCVGALANFVWLRNKLDLEPCSQNETRSYLGELLYRKKLVIETGKKQTSKKIAIWILTSNVKTC